MRYTRVVSFVDVVFIFNFYYDDVSSVAASVVTVVVIVFTVSLFCLFCSFYSLSVCVFGITILFSVGVFLFAYRMMSICLQWNFA